MNRTNNGIDRSLHSSLGEDWFRIEYFAERLEPVTMPREWTRFDSNRRLTHLLDYPFLFDTATLVTYFRSINYSRMNLSYETSKSSLSLMSSGLTMDHDLLSDRQHREKLWEGLATANALFLVLEIRRTDVLLDTFNSIWRREERELMRPLKVHLGEEEGEEGLDMGGVQIEFFRLAIADALNPDYGKPMSFPQLSPTT